MHLIEVLVDCRLLQDYQPDLKIETLDKKCLFCPNLPGFKWDSLLVTISSSLNFWGIAYNRSSACFSVPRSFLPCLVPLVLAAERVGFEFHYIFYTNSGKETHFRLECPFMPFSLELSEHVFSPKAFHAFFTWTF